jgi:hypothetical protein
LTDCPRRSFRVAESHPLHPPSKGAACIARRESHQSIPQTKSAVSPLYLASPESHPPQSPFKRGKRASLVGRIINSYLKRSLHSRVFISRFQKAIPLNPPSKGERASLESSILTSNEVCSLASFISRLRKTIPLHPPSKGEACIARFFLVKRRGHPPVSFFISLSFISASTGVSVLMSIVTSSS